MDREDLYQIYLQSRTVTTDSRAITPGCLFFAFRGATFDGNAFAPQALEQGAALCVISDGRYRVDDRCVVVDDVLETLQWLARRHRQSLRMPVVGITGTNGKTTTKELVKAVASRRYRTHATQGNFNNHLGVPLTLLATPADAEVVIVEMGANHPGEITQLCQIADPDLGLITNVGRAHLAGFGSFEGVVRTKTELYRHLAAKGGTALVNMGNSLLRGEAEACGLKTVGYGDAEGAQVRGHLVGADPYMKFYMEDGDDVYTVQSQLLGAYNFDNAMAAAAMGRLLRVDYWDIKQAIEGYRPQNNRSQWKHTGRNALVLDCYNANPSSMQVALDSFEAMGGGHKVAILGRMSELGDASEEAHCEVLRHALDAGCEQVVLVGPEFKNALQSVANPRGVAESWFADVEKAKAYLQHHPIEGCTVLLKGSNSARLWLLEEVL